MTEPRILHYAGDREDDEALLRLLLRSARKRLSVEWAWGEAAASDLRLRDGASPADDGHPARPGRIDARIIAESDPEPAGPFLRRPLVADAFVALLEAVASKPATPADDAAAAPASLAAGIAPAGEEDVLRPLLYFLPKRVLGGPARIERAGAPALTIDPESRMFWAEGILPDLEPYSRQPLRFGDWQRVSADELETLRKGLPGRPCLYLTWMDTYLHSQGVLSRRLDPDGNYGLSKRLELANDYPHALRISAQMTRPRRLDAIARACGVDLAEVHNVVNAYEAIGYLDWTRAGAPARRG
ncbi:MAG: hypothetical protein JSS45_05930 [Proteobacteria bacterium]|nr:hypothetical protein [Pseudomonadota bacterium]